MKNLYKITEKFERGKFFERVGKTHFLIIFCHEYKFVFTFLLDDVFSFHTIWKKCIEIHNKNCEMNFNFYLIFDFDFCEQQKKIDLFSWLKLTFSPSKWVEKICLFERTINVNDKKNPIQKDYDFLSSSSSNVKNICWRYFFSFHFFVVVHFQFRIRIFNEYLNSHMNETMKTNAMGMLVRIRGLCFTFFTSTISSSCW